MKIPTLMVLGIAPLALWAAADPGSSNQSLQDTKGLSNCQPVIRPAQQQLLVSGSTLDDDDPNMHVLTFSMVWTRERRNESHLTVFHESDSYSLPAFANVDFTVTYTYSSGHWTAAAVDSRGYSHLSEEVQISDVTDVGVWEHPDPNSIWVYALHNGWLTKIKITGVQV